MRIGICTTDFERAMPAKELFSKVAELGYDCVQLAFGSVSECGFTPSDHIEIPGAVSEEAIAAIRAASDETGIPVSSVNGTWNMAHPDADVRAEGLRRFSGFLDAVAALGCSLVSLCSGSRSRKGLWTYDPDTASEGAWADMLESMRASCAMAEARGITLAIETEYSNVISTPERARRVMDEVGSPALKMILDCANLFRPGEASPATARPVIGHAMELFGRDVVLAHGKDIRQGEGILFCGTGFGVVDFPFMLGELKQAGFAGDMMLHGIYEEKDMPGCLNFMRECVRGSENV